MNIHHLELFYFVVKHGGIAGAVRNIPYGIQQPAVSGQSPDSKNHSVRSCFSDGHSRFHLRAGSFSSLSDRSSKTSMSLPKGCARTARRNCASPLRQSCYTITCRKSYNAFEQNFPPSDFIYTRQLGLRPSNCFWLAKSILRLC